METPETTRPPRRPFTRTPGRGDLLPTRAEGIWGIVMRLKARAQARASPPAKEATDAAA